MLPSIRHRLLIGAAIAIGALGWLLVAEMLRPADGSPGLTLMGSRMGLIMALAVVAAAGLPAAALGVFTSAAGNPLSGVFAVSAALAGLAAAGGSMEGWVRGASLPRDFGWLIVECFVWQAGLVVMLAMIQHFRSPLRTRWPALAFQDHLGVDIRIQIPELHAIGAGTVSALFAAVLCYFLIRNADEGQVIGALTIAFGVGGLAGQTVFPQSNPAGILLSPFVVAAVSYGYVLLRFADRHEVLTAWYDQSLPGMAKALPIHYASAAVAGCTIGMGIAQCLDHSRAQEGLA